MMGAIKAARPGLTGQEAQDLRVEENDGQGGREGQAEPEVEKREGVGEKEEEGAEGDGVEKVGLPPKELACEEGQGHDRRPENRGPAFNQQGIEKQEDDQGRVGSPLGNMANPKDKKKNERDNAYV